MKISLQASKNKVDKLHNQNQVISNHQRKEKINKSSLFQ